VMMPGEYPVASVHLFRRAGECGRLMGLWRRCWLVMSRLVFNAGVGWVVRRGARDWAARSVPGWCRRPRTWLVCCRGDATSRKIGPSGLVFWSSHCGGIPIRRRCPHGPAPTTTSNNDPRG